MTTPRYVQRLGRVFEALATLDLYPNGLLLDDLAGLLGCDVEEVRADLKAHNAGTDLGPFGLTVWVEFLSRLPAESGDDDTVHAGAGDDDGDDDDRDGDDGDDDDRDGDDGDGDDRDGDDRDGDDLYVEPADAVAVRLHRPAHLAGGGLAGGLTVADVGAALVAAEDLSRAEPDNVALTEVVAQLRSRWLPGVTEVRAPLAGRRFEAELTGAIAARRQVRIAYERTWQPGIVRRIVEPYALVRTHRGFEVDAGPLDADGSVRTYLVDQISELEVLDETFERPGDVEQLCAAHRRTTRVQMVVPASRAWVPEVLAEQVVTSAADEDVQVTMDVIEPLRERVGLVLLQAGPDAFVVAPESLTDADDELARRLLTHHGLARITGSDSSGE